MSPLPSNRKPIKNWTDQDEAFLDVVQEIRQEVTRLLASSNYSPPKESSANQIPLALKPAPDNSSPQPSNPVENDLTLELPLSIAELTYGIEKKIALDHGSIIVLVPSGLSPGMKIRIRGQGKLNPKINQRGDLYLKIAIFQKVEVSLEDYQQKLRLYEKEFIKVLQWEYPLSEHSREGFKKYQQILKLRNEDVRLLEEQVTTKEIEKREYKVTSLINEADRLLKNNQLDEAALKYKAALRLDPKSVRAHIGFGDVLSEQGKDSEAAQEYRQAIALNPDDAEAHFSLGGSLYNQEMFEDAIDEYRQAIKINPNFELAHLGLWITLKQSGRLKEADLALEQFIRFTLSDNLTQSLLTRTSEKDTAAIHVLSGYALYDQGKLEAAIAELEIAIHLEPTNSRVRETLEIIRNKNKGFWRRLFS